MHLINNSGREQTKYRNITKPSANRIAVFRAHPVKTGKNDEQTEIVQDFLVYKVLISPFSNVLYKTTYNFINTTVGYNLTQVLLGL